MNSVSPFGGRRHEPAPDILPFDAAGAGGRGGDDDDDDDGSDDDTTLAPTDPEGVAVSPLPCRRPKPGEGPRLVYTLCVVMITPDPDDPDDPDYIADGQAVREFAYLEDAREAADL